jgi:alanyl-tRNA synthetase
MAERLYYAEPFRASFDAHVADIRQVSQSQGRALWQVALDRTAFYPTSGGQPHDTGALAATAPSGATLQAPIVDVEEDAAGEIWHTTAKPLLAGTAVRGEIDWDRRHDHMQQHSGQHLLSAVFLRETSAATVSFHLGEAVSTIDLAVNGLSAAELERVEEAANAIIAEDRAISMRTIPRGEAEELLATGTLRKLPPREGAIRLIEIENLDLNACGGTHLHSTGQIGGLLVRGTERAKQSLRVEFVCGLRAVRAARQDRATLTRIATALSVGRDQTPTAVERLLAENKASNKEHLRLLEDLAGAEAARLALETPVKDGRRLVSCSFADRDMIYLKLLASRLVAAPQTCALLASDAEDPAKVVLAANADLGLDCGALIREALASFGARGGGSPGMAQGQIPRAQLAALLSRLEAMVRGG